MSLISRLLVIIFWGYLSILTLLSLLLYFLLYKETQLYAASGGKSNLDYILHKMDERLFGIFYGANPLASSFTKEAIFTFLILTLSFSTLVLFFITFYFIKRKILSPLEQLSDSVKNVLTGEEKEVLHIATNDELGRLSYSFRHMISELYASRNEAITSAMRLKQSEMHLRAILNHIADGIITFTPEGLISSFNPAAERMFGYAADTIISQNISLLFSPSSWQAFSIKLEEYIGEVGDSYSSMVYELEAQRIDQTTFPATLAISRVVMEHTHLLCIAIIHDTSSLKATETVLRKAKEEAEAARSAKNDFLANMSHEIRTPMNSIVGMAELLQNTSLEQDQLFYTHSIHHAADILLTILDDILNVIHLETGQLMLKEESFNLPELLHYLTYFLTADANSKNIEIICYCPPTLKEQWIGDVRHIRRILVNLLSNAVKFTKEGYVLLSVSSTEIAYGKANLTFSVKDTGIGIKEEDKKVIFNVFNQLDNSDTRKYGGIGLGLSLSKRLAELLKGELSVISSEGHGSVFQLTLPLTLDTSRKPSLLPAILSTAQILLVDSCPKTLETLSKYLAHHHVSHSTSSHMEEALSLIKEAKEKERPYTTVMIGHHPSLLNAYALKEQATNTAYSPHTRYVLCHSLRGNDLIDSIKKAGFSAFLLKPSSEKHLITTLAAVEAMSSPSEFYIFTELFPVLTSPTSTPAVRLPENCVILLAEDHPMNQELMISLLHRLGYMHIDIANNGKEAVLKTQSKHYDLILMDCQMPEMDGFEATLHIRAKEKEKGGHIPIIAITADVIKAKAEKCFLVGMDDYLNKPIHLSTLEEALSKWLHERH